MSLEEMLHQSAVSQLWIFLISVGTGIAFGLVYEVFRLTRLFFRTCTLVVFVEDMIYAFICSAATVLFIFFINGGQVRLYIILSIFFGIVLYCLTIGRLASLLYKRVSFRSKINKTDVNKPGARNLSAVDKNEE